MIKSVDRMLMLQSHTARKDEIARRKETTEKIKKDIKKNNIKSLALFFILVLSIFFYVLILFSVNEKVWILISLSTIFIFFLWLSIPRLLKCLIDNKIISVMDKMDDMAWFYTVINFPAKGRKNRKFLRGMYKICTDPDYVKENNQIVPKQKIIYSYRDFSKIPEMENTF
ncbi:MAG: hypothetical protein LBQ60_09875 [Bacteroidales bacterium]|jgi:hypothetical protein|nr:hypothetical protein [Bacteroidales bacterium]